MSTPSGRFDSIVIGAGQSGLSLPAMLAHLLDVMPRLVADRRA